MSRETSSSTWSRVQQGTSLRQACLGEIATVLTGEGAEQGNALQAEQVRQRMLIDHQPMLGTDMNGLQLFLLSLRQVRPKEESSLVTAGPN